MKTIAVLVGSLRKESFTGKIADNVSELFPNNYKVQFVEIGNLPMYNQDYDDENNAPREYDEYRSIMKNMDAVLIVTSEHNRTIPAVLKNAVDVGSRPMSENIWDGTPIAIISQSPGQIGGFGANHHLRQSMTAVNAPMLQQPEAYIGASHELLNENGKINNEGTIEFLQSFVDAFIDLIERY